MVLRLHFLLLFLIRINQIDNISSETDYPWTSSSQPSIHEMHMANAIKIGPGSYRLASPKIFSHSSLAVDRTLKLTRKSGSSTESDATSSCLAPNIAFAKLAAMAEKSIPRKRTYFSDVLPLEESSSKKPIRVTKQFGVKYQDPSHVLLSKTQRGHKLDDVVENTEVRSEMLMEPTVDVDTYEEVTEAEEYDGEVESLPPSFLTPDREVISGNMYRELKGENNYLKEQLQASILRVKQLEALLIQRNSHVKNLVSENLQLSIKCRKLMGALGEEEAREALA